MEPGGEFGQKQAGSRKEVAKNKLATTDDNHLIRVMENSNRVTPPVRQNAVNDGSKGACVASPSPVMGQAPEQPPLSNYMGNYNMASANLLLNL